MSEEVPFKSIKITLSDEAISKLAYLRFVGSFRSNSATVEECIRTVFDISQNIGSEIERTAKENQKIVPLSIQAETLRRITFRIGRFIKLSEDVMKKLRTHEPSAGT